MPNNLCQDGLIDQPLAALSPLARWREQGDAEAARIAALSIPSADWGAYATGDIDVCACGYRATVLLHGVHDTLDIALCDECHEAYCASVPDDQPEDDYSDCPAGPGEPTYKHTCDYHRDALGRCTMCLTDEADALYHRLLSERDRWPIRSSLRAGFEPLLDKAHRRVLRRIRRQGTAVIAWTDGETPDYKDGCAPVVARAALIATALVLAALLRS